MDSSDILGVEEEPLVDTEDEVLHLV